MTTRAQQKTSGCHSIDKLLPLLCLLHRNPGFLDLENLCSGHKISLSTSGLYANSRERVLGIGARQTT